MTEDNNGWVFMPMQDTTIIENISVFFCALCGKAIFR